MIQRGSITVCTVFLLFVSVFWLLPSSASACSCVAPPPPKEAREQASAVFAGTVKEVRSTDYGKQVLFEVQTTWKAANQSQVFVSTGHDSASCGIEFQKGVSYLVYAHPDTYYANNGELATNLCTRTAPLADAQADLGELGQGSTPIETVQLEQSGSSTYLIGIGIAIVALLLIGLVWRMRKRRT
ncbi:MAG: hypothetical protein ACM32O_05475 [Clostridia bacterium]